jgi:1-deoxy-D-xylulose-5-phosphate reductoisomerase
VVKAFLHEKVNFLKMPDIIEQTMQKIAYVPQPTIDDYIACDADARGHAQWLVDKQL